MFTLFIILHILVAIFMVLVIMFQSGQGGGLSGAFGGGGGSQTLFGGRGAATFLSKATAYLGAAFLIVSFMLAYAQAHRGGAVSGRNIIRETLPPATQPAPLPAGSGAGEEFPASGEQPLLPGEEPADLPGSGTVTPSEPSAPDAEPAGGSDGG